MEPTKPSVTRPVATLTIRAIQPARDDAWTSLRTLASFKILRALDNFTEPDNGKTPTSSRTPGRSSRTGGHGDEQLDGDTELVHRTLRRMPVRGGNRGEGRRQKRPCQDLFHTIDRGIEVAIGNR